jgi:hypothetical protein
MADGADLTLRVPASDGGQATFTCCRAGEKLTLTGDGNARAVRLLLRSSRAAGKITNGKLLREVSEGLMVEWSDPSKPITLSLTE